MGFADSLNAEDRVQVKFSDFYNLVKGCSKYEVARNAVMCGVPNKFIYEMLTGETNELQEEKEKLESKLVELQEYLEKYMNTGLTPYEVTELLEKQRMYEEEKLQSIVDESAAAAAPVPDSDTELKQATQTEEVPAPDPEPTESTPSAATVTGGAPKKGKRKPPLISEK